MSADMEEQDNTKTKKKPIKKAPVFIIAGAVLCVAIAILAYFLVTSANRQNKYKEAVEMYSERQYEQAVSVFSELGDYKDSPEYLDMCNYDRAVELFEQGSYADAVVLFEGLGEYGDCASYLDSCYAAIGDSLIENGSYDEAQAEYNKLSDSDQKAQLLKRCDYLKAKQLFSDKKYTEAIEAFEALGTYSDSLSYIDKCKVEMKYSEFDFSGSSEENLYKGFYMFCGEGEQLADSAAAEKKLSFLYRTWYDDNDKRHEITSTLFDGKEYGVLAMSDQTALISMTEDGMDKLYVVSVEEDSLIGQRMYMRENASVHTLAEYSSVTTEQYNAAYEEQQQARQPNYSNDEIADMTLTKARDKLHSFYRALGYSAVQVMYQFCQEQSSSVSYDWSTRTYTCYMTVSYSTELVDIFGTSTNYYDVVATYQDNGSELISMGFSIS